MSHDLSTATAAPADAAVEAEESGAFPATTRRQLLRLGAASTAAVALEPVLSSFGGSTALEASAGDEEFDGGPGPAVPKFARELTIPGVLAPPPSADGVDTYHLTAKAVQTTSILGPKYPETEIWAYNGVYPGPTILQTRNGNRSVVTVKNELQEAISTHLHGSPSQPDYDGHPEDLTAAGGTKTYRYPNDEEARTLWYHDHAMHQTARHVYKGMAGFFIQRPASSETSEIQLETLFKTENLRNATSAATPSSIGTYDVPLMFSDMQFTADGRQVFDDDGGDDLFGNVQLVNGIPWPKMTVQRRKYRFRLLVASVSRGYVFRLSNGMPMQVIGTDSCLVPTPIPTTSLRQGMAERYEVVIDFSDLAAGTKVLLLNTRVDSGPMRQVMQFVVAGDKVPDADDPPLPAVMHVITDRPNPAKVVATRRFRFERSGGEWVINGKPWETGRVDASPKAGTTERWILENSSGGWFHPVHIHLVDFQIVKRNGAAPRPYERGTLKDVAYVGENETLEVLMHFRPPTRVDPDKPVTGRYVMHCHNLVHEDADMMNQFELTAAGIGGGHGGRTKRHSMMLQWELDA